MNKINLETTISEDLNGARLDKALAESFPDYSRSKLKEWIESGAVRVNGAQLRPKDKVSTGDEIKVFTEIEIQTKDEAQPIPLNIVFEDDDLIVINKPIGLVVHPAAGNYDGTLLNALLYHCPELKNLPRAGIVHRIDKDTSGLLVVAKTLEAHTSLVNQLQERTMGRTYDCIVEGEIVAGSTIREPIDRHPKNRKLMAVVHDGKEAITHYRVLERFKNYTHLTVKLETGRTHQIRVHMAHIRHPLVGDKTYAGRLRIFKGTSDELKAYLQKFSRQALHARELRLIHPRTDEEMVFECPLPEDLNELIKLLKRSS